VRQTVLFVNHPEVACGVGQYGRRLAHILRGSECYDFLSTTEVGSRAELDEALLRLGKSHDLVAVVYNYTDLTLPWLDLSVVRSRPDLAHFALYHEGTLPWGPTAKVGEPKRLPSNAWMFVVDSTHVDTSDALAVPRPLLDPVTPRERASSVPVISSFGFGLPGKGFARLAHRVNEEFDEALIRIHITTSAFCDATGARAVEAIASCRDVVRKPDVRLEVTRRLMSDEELMAWLAESDLCAFLYDDLAPGRWRGLSSVTDYALSANVPIAVTHTPMFRHITDAEPSICVEDRSLHAILYSGPSPLDPYRERWSHTNLVWRYEEVLSSCLNGLPVRLASSPARAARAANRFLRSRFEVDEATASLKKVGAPTNTACPPKNWDLLAGLGHVNGRVLDLGSGTDGSFFLKACASLGLGTERWGIDIAPSPPVEGAQVIVGDLIHTPFRDGYFQTLACLSVIEHGVDLVAFAAECVRLLSPGGRLVVSFDAWEPKVDTSKLSIYGLPWRVFSRQDVERLTRELASRGLVLTSPIDWTLGDPVIRPGYFSPFHGIEYTFGLLVFERV
jgi:SAM-dependent methyltransferase